MIILKLRSFLLCSTIFAIFGVQTISENSRRSGKSMIFSSMWPKKQNYEVVKPCSEKMAFDCFYGAFTVITRNLTKYTRGNFEGKQQEIKVFSGFQKQTFYLFTRPPGGAVVVL